VTTTQTVLLVAGSAVGVFVLLKVMQPAPALAKPTRAATDTISLNSIIGLGSTIAGFFKGDSTPNDMTYHADTSGFSISGNTLVDSGGNELVYGTGY
jgi:hypothetical protein